MGTKAPFIAVPTAVALLVLLAGCSTTPEALEAKSDAIVENYANNYEEIYQRIADTARRCFAGPGTPALTMAVEADLRKELGFGEVRFVAIGVVYSNYYVSVKIERVASGSRVSLRTLYPGYKRIFRWAGGDRQC
ncbi:MAG: hypothetical protein J0H42_02500 [Rhizobiales bacterium]|nr:hypothetical protein [Hyphomicrobiales bacterium]